MKKLLILMTVFTLSLSLFSCDEEYTEVTFKVTCTGSSDSGGFSGYYIIDDGAVNAFDESDYINSDSSTTYYSSSVLEDFNYLEVFAQRDSYDSTLIIRIYEDGVLYESKTLSADSDESDVDNNYISLTYEYEEGLDDDDE
jgi:hypothetical protein